MADPFEVESVAPFHRTTEPGAKLEPFTVRVKLAPPACAVAGLRLLIAGGAAAVIVKVDPFETTPPVFTVMLAVPTARTRFALTVAVIDVVLTKAVGRVLPFHWTAELGPNPDPFTVRVKAGLPACIVEGFRLLITGVAPAVMMNVELFETPPLALTVMLGAPCEAISPLPTDAVSWLALTNTVGNPDPFHRTVEPAVNPEPFTVKVNPAPPAGVCGGLRLVIVGTGAVTVKEAPLDKTPPLLTATVKTPSELMKLAGIAAVNCVALTKVVETGSPLHITTELAVKPDPLTVRVKP